jgi:hypothetical protein
MHGYGILIRIFFGKTADPVEQGRRMNAIRTDNFKESGVCVIPFFPSARSIPSTERPSKRAGETYP